MSKKELRLVEFEHYIQVGPLSRGLEIDTLSPRVYYFQMTDSGPIFVKGPERFPEPSVLFGTDILRRTIAVGRKWATTEHTLGVMAVGNKGSGKTQLLNHIANKAMDMDKIPCFHIKGKLPAEILEFISDKIGDAIFLFDEYGKYYCTESDSNGNTRPSDELLQFMSEKSKNRRLIMLAENNAHKISEFIQNRPGRVHFRFNMTTCTESELSDIIKHSGIGKDAEAVIREGARVWSVDDARTAAEEAREIELAMPDAGTNELYKALRAAITDINIPMVHPTSLSLRVTGTSRISFMPRVAFDPDDMRRVTVTLEAVFIANESKPDITFVIEDIVKACEKGSTVYDVDGVRVWAPKTDLSKMLTAPAITVYSQHQPSFGHSENY